MQALGGGYSLCCALGRPNHDAVSSFGFPGTSETPPNQTEPRDSQAMVVRGQGVRGEAAGAGLAQPEMRRQRGTQQHRPLLPKGVSETPGPDSAQRGTGRAPEAPAQRQHGKLQPAPGKQPVPVQAGHPWDGAPSARGSPSSKAGIHLLNRLGCISAGCLGDPENRSLNQALGFSSRPGQPHVSASPSWHVLRLVNTQRPLLFGGEKLLHIP